MISIARRSAVVLTTHALKKSSARHFSVHTTSRLYPFLRTHYRAGFVNDQTTRGMTTFKQSDITIEEYHRASDTTMEALLDSLESLVDQNTDLPYEVEYSSGVLTLNLADQGIYVINKQPPNKQIWLSSPRSGPKRYDLDATEKEWFYTRDNTTMRSLLEDELSDVFGKRIHIDLGEQE